MKPRTPVRVLTVTAACALAAAGTASASGTWEAYPGQSVTSQTSIQQPINADGSSNFKSGKGVIPVQFSLSRGLGPFVFESIGSDASTDNDYSFVSYTPSAATTFSEVATLAADYAFTAGDCHGGSLRWSVRVSPTQSVFIYYGALSSLASCTGADSQSAANMIGRPDLRYDTSQVGGTFYDSYANAVTLVGSMPIVRASLVLDSGWGGDQRLTLGSATVNTDTFTPPAATAPAPTCNLPAATIKVTKISGSTSGQVNEPVTIQPNDNDANLRVVACKYMYNLATSSLPGPGRYQVEVVIDGVTAPGAAGFDLR